MEKLKAVLHLSDACMLLGHKKSQDYFADSNNIFYSNDRNALDPHRVLI